MLQQHFEMCGFGATDLVVLRRGAVDCACSAVTCAVSVLWIGWCSAEVLTLGTGRGEWLVRGNV